jgi:hypothetical protein
MSDISIPGYVDDKITSRNQLLRSIIVNRGELTEIACAECLYSLYKDEFLYHEGWYQYNNNKWLRIKDCVELRRRIPGIKVFIDDENKKLRADLTILENEIRDCEEEIEKDEEHIIVIKRNINALEAKRINLLQARTQLDKTAFKNNILIECRDLFFTEKGVIRESKEQCDDIGNTPGSIKNKKESRIKLFVKFLVTEDVDFEKEDVLLLTSKDVFSKFNQFLETNRITYKVNVISFVKLLKNLNIKGIQTGINTMKCKKIEFIKKDIKNYFGC